MLPLGRQGMSSLTQEAFEEFTELSISISRYPNSRLLFFLVINFRADHVEIVPSDEYQEFGLRKSSCPDFFLIIWGFIHDWENG
ncbi:hypothetical protein V6N13_119144 [Hibiscus sabdariffa]